MSTDSENVMGKGVIWDSENVTPKRSLFKTMQRSFFLVLVLFEPISPWMVRGGFMGLFRLFAVVFVLT